MADYPAKYDALIDAETWAFIEKTNSLFPSNASSLPIERQREYYNAMAREFFAGYPEGVDVTSSIVEGKTPVAIRTYRNAGLTARAQIVYLHGGGYVFGDLDSHDDVCAELCEATGFETISVDYRLAPENLFPADFEDALAGFLYALSQSDLPVIMAGDSAGANLAAAVCHKVRIHNRQLIGQVLVYPGLGGDITRGSYLEHANAPLLSTTDISFYTHVRSNGVKLEGDPFHAVLHDTDYSRLPPTVVISAECDPLCDDGLEYCQRIGEAGGKAHWIKEPGLVHGYLRARHSVKRAGDSFCRIIEAVSELGEGRWPY